MLVDDSEFAERGSKRTVVNARKKGRKLKRAITLAGHGPAAGWHIGALRCLKQAGIEFDVWALSGIGAWVGVVYNQADEGDEVEQANDFFRNRVFRDDTTYRSFPFNRVSAPDWVGNAEALAHFLLEPANFRNLFPKRILQSFARSMSPLSGKQKWTEADLNRWALNDVVAVNPLIRLWISMQLRSNVDGVFRTFYPDSTFLNNIKFERLYADNKPAILYNAWNLSKQRLELFSNKNDSYKPITSASLCACSALPFLDASVEIDGDAYCEGTLVDSVNFKTLLKDHPDLDEIWVIRFGDARFFREPHNLHDSLGNLFQLYEATVVESDAELFKYHVKEENNWHGRIVEVHINSDLNFEWSHKNFDQASRLGYVGAEKACALYVGDRSSESRQRGKPDLLETGTRGPKRNLNAWIDDPQPRAGRRFKVLINIGTPNSLAKASVPFLEPDWKGIDSIDLLISVSSIGCDVDPSWQKLILRRTGTSDTIAFSIVTDVPGNHEFSINVYLEKQMIQLQSLSFMVTVAAAQIQTMHSGN